MNTHVKISTDTAAPASADLSRRSFLVGSAAAGLALGYSAVPGLLGAIFTVHLANGFFFNNPNGGWEFPAFWVLALVAQALLGDGPFTLVQTSWLGKAFVPVNARQEQAL